MVPGEAASISDLPQERDTRDGSTYSGQGLEGSAEIGVAYPSPNRLAKMVKNQWNEISAIVQATPGRERVARFLGALTFVNLVILIIPWTPLTEPFSGIVAMSCVLLCCWYGGPWISIIIPLYISVLTRLIGTESKPLTPTSRAIARSSGLKC